MSQTSPHALYAQRALRYMVETLRRERERLGRPQAAAGAAVGLSGKTISNVEAHARALRLEKLLEYGHSLGLDGPSLFPPDPDLPRTKLLQALDTLGPEWIEVLLGCLTLAIERQQARSRAKSDPATNTI